MAETPQETVLEFHAIPDDRVFECAKGIARAVDIHDGAPTPD